MDQKEIEIDVQLDQKTLTRFLLRNNFFRAGGVAGLLVSLGALVVLVVFWGKLSLAQGLLLLFLGLMFTVIQPASLLAKGWAQLKNGAFRKPFHYRFSPEGIEVTNIAGTVQVDWKEIRRVIVAKDAFYIYMNAVSAFIIPRRECGESYVPIAKMLKEYRE